MWISEIFFKHRNKFLRMLTAKNKGNIVWEIVVLRFHPWDNSISQLWIIGFRLKKKILTRSEAPGWKLQSLYILYSHFGVGVSNVHDKFFFPPQIKKYI